MKNLTTIIILLLIMIACTPAETNEASEPTAPQPVEFGDSKYIDLAKQGMPAMMNQDLDAFVANIAEDGLYIFSAGDTLAGKAAIRNYWAGRMEAIDQIKIENDVWLAVKVNESENAATGNWVMGWFDVNATYTTGKSMSQNVHTLYHYNDADQVDVVVQYIDRLPIVQAQSTE